VVERPSGDSATRGDHAVSASAAGGDTTTASETSTASGDMAATGSSDAAGEADAARDMAAAGDTEAAREVAAARDAAAVDDRTFLSRSAARFRRLSCLRRWFLIGAVALVCFPFLLIADSYLIVRDVRPLAREAPRETRVMRDRRADRRTPQPLRQRWVNLGAMSPHLAHAVVVHEDATFFEHHGFDEFEIRAALERSWDERRLVRGASTITTQLARNLYLGTGRSLIRKLRELPLTVRLERALSKRRILELYLNFAEWGPGVFGVEAASRYHFNTSARNLSPARAALLTAALPSPRRSTPARPSPYLRRRAAIILARMQARGWLTAAELQAARQELGLRGPAPGTASPEELEAARAEVQAEAEAEATLDREPAPEPSWGEPTPAEPQGVEPPATEPQGVEPPATEPQGVEPPATGPTPGTPATSAGESPRSEPSQPAPAPDPPGQEGARAP